MNIPMWGLTHGRDLGSHLVSSAREEVFSGVAAEVISAPGLDGIQIWHGSRELLGGFGAGGFTQCVCFDLVLCDTKSDKIRRIRFSGTRQVYFGLD